MTQLYHRAVCLAALTAASLVALSAAPAAAQCTTCATPTVAYYQPAPAVVAPTYATWYRPGLFDRLRMRRWGVAPVAVAPAYTAAYAPYASYSASYTPYVASYTPYSASYAPYVTAYAPLQSPVVQTSYYAPPASGCSTCGQTSCGCETAVLRPVYPEPACTTCNYGCSTCATETPCSTCASYPAAPSSSCSSCSSSAGQIVYAQPEAGCSTCGGTAVSPATPQPQMTPQEAAPASGAYPGTQVVPPAGATPDPAPAADDASTYLAPPQLLGPTNDRTANRPTVDVWNAVYHQPAKAANVSTAIAKPVNGSRSQAEIESEGWESVPVAR